MKNLIIAVLLVLALFVAEAKTKRVNLDRLSEKKRTEYLISKAKEVVMHFGHRYYREYVAPVIERGISGTSKASVPQSYMEANANRSYYKVGYLYDRSKERFWGDYSAEVYIWVDTGEAFSVMFGNGHGIALYDLTEEELKKGCNMAYDSTRHEFRYRKPQRGGRYLGNNTWEGWSVELD